MTGAMTGGFQNAWAAYLCAMYGHHWTWVSNGTGQEPPKGCVCHRCGTVKS